MDVLNVRNLKKSFGDRRVIDGISLDVPENSVYGFIGVNGAGKTTTMRMIMGLLQKDGGEITVCGKPVAYGETGLGGLIGYLPDVPEFYGFMRPMEYMRMCGAISRMPSGLVGERARELLGLVGLKDQRKRIGSFSRGMKQRLGVAQALLNEPRLLICDEPTSALDPIGRKDVLGILGDIRDRTTVLLSTHILSDVEKVCDRVAVLHGGKIAMDGTLGELRSRHRADKIRIEFMSSADKASFLRPLDEAGSLEPASQGSGVPWVAAEDRGTELTLEVKDVEGAMRAMLRILTDRRIMPLRLEVMEPGMEGLFLEAIA